MSNIILKAKLALNNKNKSCGLKTITIRKISASLFKDIKNKAIDDVFILCEEFLKDRSWEMGVIAFDWAFRMKKYYKENTFVIFERWLKEYIRGWGDCDDFCTHALGELLCQYNVLFHHLVTWTKHEDFWVRRATAVTLIPAIKKGNYNNFDPFLISDKLMKDNNHLVRKAYGWMLKVYSVKEQDKVYDYLVKNKKVMPRDAYRYAMEKMPLDIKKELMKK